MNLRELQEKRGEKLTALNAIVAAAEADEKRSLTDAEKSKFDQLETEISELDKDIKRAKRAAELNKANITPADMRSGEDGSREIKANFSFRDTLNAAATGKLEGFVLEMHTEGEREARALGKSIKGVAVPQKVLESRADITTTTGAGAIGYQPTSFLDQLQSKFLGTELGMQILTGLLGVIPVGRGKSFSASWTAEGTANNNKVGAIDALELKPRRVGGTAAISRQLLLSSSIGVETFLQRNIIAAINSALMYAVVAGTGIGEPEGILTAPGVGNVIAGDPDGAALTFADILALEKLVKTDSGLMGNMAYLTNPKVRAQLKALPKVSGGEAMVWNENNIVNGYNAYSNDQVPSTYTKGASSNILSAIIFGDFSQMWVGQWGGLDIIADNITRKSEAITEFQIDSYWDVLVKQAAAFAKCMDIIA